jgi:hypothetical protein
VYTRDDYRSPDTSEDTIHYMNCRLVLTDKSFCAVALV